MWVGVVEGVTDKNFPSENSFRTLLTAAIQVGFVLWEDVVPAQVD